MRSKGSRKEKVRSVTTVGCQGILQRNVGSQREVEREVRQERGEKVEPREKVRDRRELERDMVIRELATNVALSGIKQQSAGLAYMGWKERRNQ